MDFSRLRCRWQKEKEKEIVAKKTHKYYLIVMIKIEMQIHGFMIIFSVLCGTKTYCYYMGKCRVWWINVSLMGRCCRQFLWVKFLNGLFQFLWNCFRIYGDYRLKLIEAHALFFISEILISYWVSINALTDKGACINTFSIPFSFLFGNFHVLESKYLNANKQPKEISSVLKNSY